MSLHYLKSMWNMGVNTTDIFDAFISNVRLASQQLSPESLYEILKIEKIPSDIEEKVFSMLIEISSSNFRKILELIGVFAQYEDREFAVCESLAKSVKRLKIPEKFIEENDHLSGLMDQDDLKSLKISTKQVMTILSILIEFHFLSIPSGDFVEPFWSQKIREGFN